MAYSDFTLPILQKKFGVQFEAASDIFADVPSVSISPLSQEILSYQVPLGLRMSTEKARSEFIVAPVLVEVRRQLNEQVSLFSGVEFNVDIEQGLRGICDFLMSLSSQQLFVNAPVIAIVEAKNDNIKGGIAQCAAEMIAAERFNAAEQKPIATIFGIVTTGSDWLFLRLANNTVYVDSIEYSIQQVGKIVGIIVSMLREASQTQKVQEGKTAYSVL